MLELAPQILRASFLDMVIQFDVEAGEIKHGYGKEDQPGPVAWWAKTGFSVGWGKSRRRKLKGERNGYNIEDALRIPVPIREAISKL